MSKSSILSRVGLYGAAVVALLTAVANAAQEDYTGAGQNLALFLASVGLAQPILRLIDRLHDVLPDFVDVDAIVAKLIEWLQRTDDELDDGEADDVTVAVVSPVAGVVRLDSVAGFLTVVDASGEPVFRVPLREGVEAVAEDGEMVKPGDILAGLSGPALGITD